jgi:hypothetical protein
VICSKCTIYRTLAIKAEVAKHGIAGTLGIGMARPACGVTPSCR